MKAGEPVGAFVSYLLSLAVIEALDVAVGVNISLWVFYLLPVALGTWNLGKRYGYWVAGAAALLVFADGLVFGSAFEQMRYFIISAISRAVVIFVVAWLISLLRNKEVERVKFNSPSKN